MSIHFAIVLLVLTIFVSMCSNCFYKKLSIECKEKIDIIYANGLWQIFGVVICALLCCVFGWWRELTWNIVLYSLPLGISLFCAIYFFILSMSKVTASLVILAGTASTMIPVILGSIIFGEKITLFQISGVILLITSVVVMAFFATSNDEKKMDKNTSIILGIMILSNGAIMFMQKTFSYKYHGNNIVLFIGIAFLFSFLISVASLLIKSKGNKKKKLKSLLQNKTITLAAFVISIGLSIINVIVVAISNVLPAIILFPVQNSCGLILSILMTSIVFKEKITKTKIISIIICVVGIICIALT